MAFLALDSIMQRFGPKGTIWFISSLPNTAIFRIHSIYLIKREKYHVIERNPIQAKPDEDNLYQAKPNLYQAKPKAKPAHARADTCELSMMSARVETYRRSHLSRQSSTGNRIRGRRSEGGQGFDGCKSV